MSRHSIALGLSTLAAAACAPAAIAQQTTAPVWTVHRAVKVNPGKAAEFTKFYATTIKKFHQARQESGAQIGWMLAKLVIPSGEEAPYHYVSTTFHDKFPELDQSAADLAPFHRKGWIDSGKVPGHPERCFHTGAAERVNAHRFGWRHRTRDYVRIDYMKVPPGKAGDYVNLERTIYKPLHEQRMKDGLISGWGLSAATLPGGSDRPYEFFPLNAVKKSEQIPRMTGGYGPEPFARAHPDVNYVGTVMKTQELRTIVRTYLMRVTDGLR